MILGRELEQEKLSSLLARAQSGEGGTLAVVRAPGIGKTTLRSRTELANVLRNEIWADPFEEN
ncbi:MAG TPA: hypothetical protein VJ815_10455 [Acidimicrobiia bacterium]|nr:hypothetical protein [Acidimicrobiia bacterium]